MPKGKCEVTVVPYHLCLKRPQDNVFQHIEWRDGCWKICDWKICELNGGIFAKFVPIKTIENRICPWCKLQLPNFENKE